MIHTVKGFGVVSKAEVDVFLELSHQGTLKSLLQHHSSKASILQLSAFFTVHFSHLYMTTGKTISLHVNVWQKPLQYCKVISLQLIKINEKKSKKKRKLKTKTKTYPSIPRQPLIWFLPFLLFSIRLGVRVWNCKC